MSTATLHALLVELTDDLDDIRARLAAAAAHSPERGQARWQCHQRVGDLDDLIDGLQELAAQVRP